MATSSHQHDSGNGENYPGSKQCGLLGWFTSHTYLTSVVRFLLFFAAAPPPSRQTSTATSPPSGTVTTHSLQRPSIEHVYSNAVAVAEESSSLPGAAAAADPPLSPAATRDFLIVSAASPFSSPPGGLAVAGAPLPGMDLDLQPPVGCDSPPLSSLCGTFGEAENVPDERRNTGPGKGAVDMAVMLCSCARHCTFVPTGSVSSSPSVGVSCAVLSFLAFGAFVLDSAAGFVTVGVAVVDRDDDDVDPEAEELVLAAVADG